MTGGEREGMSREEPPLVSEKPLSGAERAAIRARVEAATPGPWHWTFGNAGHFADEEAPEGGEWDHSGPDLESLTAKDPKHGYPVRVVTSFGHDADWVLVNRKDGEFIAAARADVPRLLSDLEECERSNATMQIALQQAFADHAALTTELGRLRAYRDRVEKHLPTVEDLAAIGEDQAAKRKVEALLAEPTEAQVEAVARALWRIWRTAMYIDGGTADEMDMPWTIFWNSTLPGRRLLEAEARAAIRAWKEAVRGE